MRAVHWKGIGKTSKEVEGYIAPSHLQLEKEGCKVIYVSSDML